MKFVIGSREDLSRAKEIIERFSLCAKAIVYFSSVFGQIEPEEIVEYMIEHHWNEARLQLQMHKFIWPPEQRGV